MAHAFYKEVAEKLKPIVKTCDPGLSIVQSEPMFVQQAADFLQGLVS